MGPISNFVAVLASILLAVVNAVPTTDIAARQDCGNPDNAFFVVMGCGKPVLYERADPIVEPGVRGSRHLHTIMGGDAFNFTLDYDKTQTSSCTTCAVTKDLSNYWVPTVYFRAENGSFLSVKQVGGVNVYYQERMDWEAYCAGKKLRAFPKGFRMIAGNQAKRSFEDTNEQRAIEFICLLPPPTEGLPPFHGFPNRTCDNGLQIRIRFPSCWDGVNVDSPDHKSHVAYPERLDNGPCPKTHPESLPALLYEVTWDAKAFNNLRKQGDQPFVLSQGDPTGYGYHADFLNGWDVDLLQRAIADPSCGTKGKSGGVLEKCNTFKPFMQTAEVQNECPGLKSQIDEPMFGELKALPGCNPLQWGPGDATMQKC
ncbi:hypothetical protein B0T17DRAFT_497673 [Bombardia bombarda]|uniref:DUF1996 domain-containing protein n=1 Tax=Bombardia bombarda TaxID=252184 RepID=A0AA40BVL7_9PEZI|nr:hypothetical protein B0T17DRAFT_497673 [Bombardia bombarda]